MRTPPNPRTLWLALPVLSLALATAAAQETTSLSGTVTDTTGGVVPGVELTLTDEENGATRVALSNDRGRYAFSQLAPGTYRLRAEIDGFKTALLKDLVLVDTVIDNVRTFGRFFATTPPREMQFALRLRVLKGGDR